MKVNRSNPFQYVKQNSPGYSVFDLSYRKLFTTDMAILYPVLHEEVVPGDIFEIGNQAIIRMQPLVAPVLHPIDMYVHYFFVPYRLLDTGTFKWEDFITGGLDGQDAQTLPTWNPVNKGKGYLWDALGFPVNVTPTGKLPIAFPAYAYELIRNEYYIDENLDTKSDITTAQFLRTRRWEKDYFTSALPWQQKGTAPALPLSGIQNASLIFPVYSDNIGVTNMQVEDHGGADVRVKFGPTKTGLEKGYATVDFSNAGTFNVSDLRLAFSIQKWMELSARAGSRYTESLKAHFGVAPRDERLQRPEYIGGTKSPIIISEVLQTSQTGTTPQGNLAGHGLNVSSGYAGKYRATEHGIIMGIMSIMPKVSYNSQGINRQWLRRTKYDFYWPEFANLSEQEIYTAEICAKDSDQAVNDAIFGFQGRYDEMRVKHDLVCGDMRDTYNYWHLARTFTPGSVLLNSSFVQAAPRKDIFAAPSQPGFIIEFGNIVKAIRPIPVQSNPGLIDH